MVPMGCPRHIFAWNVYGLPQSYMYTHKFDLQKKTDISVAVPLFGNVFPCIYRPLIYVYYMYGFDLMSEIELCNLI